MFDVSNGQSERDIASLPGRMTIGAIPGDVRGKRIAWSPDMDYFQVTDEVRSNCSAIVEQLKDLGAENGGDAQWDQEEDAANDRGDESTNHFSETTVEILAEIEHNRWVSERMLAGWRYGAVRNDSCRTRPSILPWSCLPEEEKQKDLDNVETALRVLAQTGLWSQSASRQSTRSLSAHPVCRPALRSR